MILSIKTHEEFQAVLSGEMELSKADRTILVHTALAMILIGQQEGVLSPELVTEGYNQLGRQGYSIPASELLKQVVMLGEILAHEGAIECSPIDELGFKH